MVGLGEVTPYFIVCVIYAGLTQLCCGFVNCFKMYALEKSECRPQMFTELTSKMHDQKPPLCLYLYVLSFSILLSLL